MFLEWENNSEKSQIISSKFQKSGKFQNNAINDVKQTSLSHAINGWSVGRTDIQQAIALISALFAENNFFFCFYCFTTRLLFTWLGLGTFFPPLRNLRQFHKFLV